MEENNVLDNFMTLEEVAEKLGISKATARNWCNKNVLTHIMVKHKCLVAKASFEALSAQIQDIDKAERDIARYMDEQCRLKGELEVEVQALRQELEDRRWTNNHIQYFSEMFALMMHTLYEIEDDITTARLVKYFLDGDDYKDIALLTGQTVQQVMGDIRKFGRSKLRAESYAGLSRTVDEQKKTIGMLEQMVRSRDRDIAGLRKIEDEYRLYMQERNRHTPESAGEETAAGVMGIRVSECGFSTRLNNILTNSGLHTVGQAMQLGRAKLFRLRNMGRQSLDEFEEFLRQHDLILPD